MFFLLKREACFHQNHDDLDKYKNHMYYFESTIKYNVNRQA